MSFPPLPTPVIPPLHRKRLLSGALVFTVCCTFGAAAETSQPAHAASAGAAQPSVQISQAPERAHADQRRTPEHGGRPLRREGHGEGAPEDRPSHPDRRSEGAADHNPGDRTTERDRRRPSGRPLDGLTPEQQALLRRAMAEAWRDENVVAARQQIEEGMVAYREALRDAVLKAAPELAEILPEKFDGKAWLGSQHRSRSVTAVRSILAGLPREVQVEAHRLHAELMADPQVTTAAEAFDRNLREDDSRTHDSRTGMSREERAFRRAYIEALVRELPAASEYFNSTNQRNRRADGDHGDPGTRPHRGDNREES